MSDQVYQRLTSVMIRVFDDDDIAARPDTTAADVGGWDSLAHVRFMLAVEREFNIGFTASEMASFKKVGDLADAIASKSSSK